MLYSSKKDTNRVSEKSDSSSEKPEQDKDSNPPTVDVGQKKPNPLEGLDEATKTCFKVRQVSVYTRV